MSIIRSIAIIEGHARTLTLTLAMLIAAFATSPARAQGPSDNSWVAPERAAHRPNPLQPTSDVLKHGQELFKRDCEQCHGKAGHGDGPQSFSLEKHPADLASERVQTQEIVVDLTLFIATAACGRTDDLELTVNYAAVAKGAAAVAENVQALESVGEA